MTLALGTVEQLAFLFLASKSLVKAVLIAVKMDASPGNLLCMYSFGILLHNPHVIQCRCAPLNAHPGEPRIQCTFPNHFGYISLFL